MTACVFICIQRSLEVLSHPQDSSKTLSHTLDIGSSKQNVVF